MPNIKSQVKRVKTNEKARQRNKAVKSALRTHVRNFRRAAEAGDAEKATQYAKLANRQLDKAVSKGVIHKNQAKNRKSSISKKLNKLALVSFSELILVGEYLTPAQRLDPLGGQGAFARAVPRV